MNIIKSHYLALATKAAEHQRSRAVIATLGDMVRETGDDDPGYTGHATWMPAKTRRIN
jgi:hypothetical protein